MSNDYDLLEDRAPYFGFPNLGDKISGVVLDHVAEQQRDFETNEPKVYSDTGKPMMQLVITLSTADGERRIYAKGNMLYAIKQARKTSGHQSTDLRGGTLTVKYVKDAEPVGRRKPAKEFAAKYEPPKKADLLGDDTEEMF